MNAEVTRYIDELEPWQADVCRQLRAMIHTTIPAVEEQIQYGKPHFSKDGSHAAVIHVANSKVSFMVFNASEIEAVEGVLRSRATVNARSLISPRGAMSTTTCSPESWPRRAPVSERAARSGSWKPSSEAEPRAGCSSSACAEASSDVLAAYSAEVPAIATAG